MLALRALIIIAFVFSGYFIGTMLGFPTPGLLTGLALGVLANLLERAIKNISAGAIAGGIIGLGAGLLV